MKPTFLTPHFSPLSSDQSLDRSGMSQHLKSWSDQVQRGWKNGSQITDQAQPPRLLVWAGMGGSAIGGDFCASLFHERSTFPLLVHRGGTLPTWLGNEDRLIAVSFSGNTAETMYAAERAYKRGVAVDVLTSGGKLAQWAVEQGIKPWIVPGGRPPRTALGDLFAFAFGTCCARGWLKEVEGELEETREIIRQRTDEFSLPPSGSSSPLASLQQILSERLAMVYSWGRLIPVARRWACQFNENAKLPAHWGELPEMNHNEVVAYFKDSPGAKKYAVIFLNDPDGENEMQQRVDCTSRMAREVGWETMVVEPSAKTPIAKMLELTVMGDWLSYWMALARGIDPTPITPIDQLKIMMESR